MCYGKPVALADIPASAGRETSGITVSTVDPTVAFVVDDGTGTNGVAATRAGKLLGTVGIEGMSASNAEALSHGSCELAESCLFVADIGDHVGRDRVSVFVIAEPDPAALPSTPVSALVWDYSYPAGPTDAESLLVDADGNLVLISKPERGSGDEHVVYRGPAGGGELTQVRTFTPPAPSSPKQSLLVGDLVTDASWTPGRVLLITYDQAIEYTAETPDADPALFSDWGFREVPMPLQSQSEGVAYLPDGCGYLVASEGGALSQVTAADCPAG